MEIFRVKMLGTNPNNEHFVGGEFETREAAEQEMKWHEMEGPKEAKSNRPLKRRKRIQLTNPN